jgi:hypothetical protein
MLYASGQLAADSSELRLVAPPRGDIPTMNNLFTTVMLYGGGGGIRTPARLAAPLGFQDRPLQPDLGTPPSC